MPPCVLRLHDRGSKFGKEYLRLFVNGINLTCHQVEINGSYGVLAQGIAQINDGHPRESAHFCTGLARWKNGFNKSPSPPLSLSPATSGTSPATAPEWAAGFWAKGWAMEKKQPKLVLRESCIFDVADTWEPASFLETGAGTGKMTQLFLDRGFHGACYELGQRSREMLRQNLLPEGDRIRVVDDLSELSPETFDYLFSFEVLEHIESDESALAEWTRYLKRGGRLLISVPSRMRKYGKSDEIVGHVRRYEKDDLTAMLERCGYSDIRIMCYGFPLTEITRRVSNWLVKDEITHEGLSMEQRSTQSSFQRPRVIDRGVAFFGGGLAWPFCLIQRMFYRTDLGDGYVVCARKSGGY